MPLLCKPLDGGYYLISDATATRLAKPFGGLRCMWHKHNLVVFYGATVWLTRALIGGKRKWCISSAIVGQSIQDILDARDNPMICLKQL